MPTPAPPSLAWRPLQRSTRVAIMAALLATMFYQLFLLNPAYRGPTWLWLAMLLAEGLTALHAIGTWWTILAHDDRDEPLAVAVHRERLCTVDAEVPDIDVFITAYGEAPALVRTTVRAARDMRLPHRTWLLDDGGSDDLERVCAEEGVRYLRRAGREHAKAGNVNAALARTAGEFVVIFDADHVPEPNFLLEVLPHFVDTDVAFVQSPQSYTNRVNLVATGSAEAQRIFYELVCPGKNRFNAAFCVGTNVMFRRCALDDIGGIYTGSNSEDIWTSIELHKRGWRSVYLPLVLARGLAPQDVASYLKQQFRWASGGFEILLRGRLFRRNNGLTVDQRLQYLFVGTHYLLSVAMLTFMFLPATYLLFALSPIRADGWTWATHYLPFQALVLLVEVHAVHHGRASPGRGEAEPLRLRRLRRGNVDRRVGPAREAPLEAEVEPLEGARVALVVDAVERVDGGRSGPPRGQTPVKPGALAVGVDDLDPEAVGVELVHDLDAALAGGPVRVAHGVGDRLRERELQVGHRVLRDLTQLAEPGQREPAEGDVFGLRRDAEPDEAVVGVHSSCSLPCG